jgi:FemAB-related protein (PEP-CTERM system-associated)
MRDLEICELEKEDEKSWDTYIHKSNSSTFFHQIAWKNVVEKTYRHKPVYLVAKENGKIKGVLPLFLMKSVIFAKKLVSVPFAPYGGICADNEIIVDALMGEAKRITEERGADYLELRNIIKKESSNLIERSLQVTSILDLGSNSDIIWRNMKRDKRRGIKKAKEANLEIIWGLKGINEFYKIYAQTMWYLGTPAHSIKFFRNIIQEFSDNINIVTAKCKNVAIASIFLLLFKENVISGWSGSLREYSSLYPNNLAYWEMLKYYCEKGYKLFDFGRSMPKSGIHEFKKSFGTETQYLHYQYYLNNMNELPDTTTANPKRQLFAKVWRKLPVPVVNVIGAKIRRNFP